MRLIRGLRHPEEAGFMCEPVLGTDGKAENREWGSAMGELLSILTSPRAGGAPLLLPSSFCQGPKSQDITWPHNFTFIYLTCFAFFFFWCWDYFISLQTEIYCERLQVLALPVLYQLPHVCLAISCQWLKWPPDDKLWQEHVYEPFRHRQNNLEKNSAKAQT